MNKDILICGVGGQGTVLASKIIASAAMEEKKTVHSAETIGMAQRGGSVTSHVRIGESYSPLIPHGSADLLLAFEPGEAVRNIKYLKKDGVVIVNTVPTDPVGASSEDNSYDASVMTDYLLKKCKCIFVNSEEVCKEFGSSKFFNIVILGIATGADVLGVSFDTVQDQLTKLIPQKFLEINKKAFMKGYEIGSNAQI